jgi:hypothetical protein
MMAASARREVGERGTARQHLQQRPLEHVGQRSVANDNAASTSVSPTVTIGAETTPRPSRPPANRLGLLVDDRPETVQRAPVLIAGGLEV